MIATPGRQDTLIDRFTSHLGPTERFRILDIGCGVGDTALRLAGLGHQALGISNDESDITRAKMRARRQGVSGATFEVMDARDVAQKFGKGFFDAVLISDMLHLVDKDESTAILDSIKGLTAPAGYNAIRGYLVDPAQSQSQSNIANMLHPGELSSLYDSDPHWQVVGYSEDPFAAQQFNGSELVSSHAEIIARKLPRI